MKAVLCSKCGYTKVHLDTRLICPVCNSNLNILPIDADDFMDLTKEEKKQVVLDFQPFEQYDPKLWQERIEYDIERSARIQRESESLPGKVQCPYCKARNCNKISEAEKAINTGLFGLFATKRYYQWHCNSCNSDF